jgi:uncharacterized protein YjbK
MLGLVAPLSLASGDDRLSGGSTMRIPNSVRLSAQQVFGGEVPQDVDLFRARVQSSALPSTEKTELLAIAVDLPTITTLRQTIERENSAGARSRQARFAGGGGKIQSSWTLGESSEANVSDTKAAQPAGAKDGNETELKLLLPDAAAAEMLAERLAPMLALQDQVNCYFDTPDDAFRRAGWSVRVREQNGTELILTVKGRETGTDSFMSHPEHEQVVSHDLWPGLRAGSLSVATVVADLLAAKGADLPAGLDCRQLRPLGTTETTRRVYLLPGAGPALHVELDRTHYPDGQVVHEVELEVPSSESSEQAMQRLRVVFEALGLPWQVNKFTKHSRFRACLRPT